MERSELAARLILADAPERTLLLKEHAHAADVGLASALNTIYQQSHAGDPTRASRAAESLVTLSRTSADPEVGALAAWTSGMAAIHLSGEMERGVALLAQATEHYTRVGRPLEAAATQVSRLQGLAMLGRYDEAIACGSEARDTFTAHSDLLAAGKIEQNLGNIAYRRGRFLEAEHLYRSARESYVAVANQAQLAQIDNCLGTVLLEELRFAEASSSLQDALVRAEQADLDVTQAEIRYNLGLLGLFTGRYDQALDQLEHVRRAYTELSMPYRALRVELDLADAYLELNLAPEAAAIASRLSIRFAELGLRAERARALACHGRALGLLRESDRARPLLAEAADLYTAEGNELDAAFMTLVEAQLLYAEGDFQAALAAAKRSEAPFAAARTWGRLLVARWLQGEAARARGLPSAQMLLESVLHEAEARAQPQIVYRSLTSLGLLARSSGELDVARQAFEGSVAVIEALRAPLPAEEIRRSFLFDKLTPFSELARLWLAAATVEGNARAFEYVERARSRALVDMLVGAVNVPSRPRNAFEGDLLRQLEQLREELQGYYTRLNRPDGAAARTPHGRDELYAAVREREERVLELRRRIEHSGGTLPGRVAPLDVDQLQRALGVDAALVEYFSLDGELLAFVVADGRIEVVDGLGSEAHIETLVDSLRFQIGTMRHAGEHVRGHQQQLAERARHHLSRLYDALLRPIERRLGQQRLVIVPHRALHYVPFHALYDGRQYVVERRSVSYAPSATVLLHCLVSPRKPIERVFLVGVADEQTPRVHDEVRAIEQLFPESVVLLDAEASIGAVQAGVQGADVVHLACHGQFRPDSPLFSSLRLGDGWLSVRDAYNLDLQCGLVALSACETGASSVAPGEELIGLARGFFSAGTPSLLVSLWTVDDASTAELMTTFYSGLRRGLGPGDALAAAQRELMTRYPHPYYWSAFTVLGRW
jgi:tetratricopeptide (TPR) repeat protein